MMAVMVVVAMVGGRDHDGGHGCGGHGCGSDLCGL